MNKSPTFQNNQPTVKRYKYEMFTQIPNNAVNCNQTKRIEMKHVIVKVYHTPRTNTTYLQGIGNVLGTIAGSLKPGDTMVWNNFGTGVVDSIIHETDKTITVAERYGDNGENVANRKMNKNRIVARPISEMVAVGKRVFELVAGDIVVLPNGRHGVVESIRTDEHDQRITHVTVEGGQTFDSNTNGIVIA